MDIESNIRITEFFVALKLFVQAKHNLKEKDLKFIRDIIKKMKELEKSN